MALQVQAPMAASSLVQKLQSRTAHIGVIGMGYVGLPLSLMFSSAQFPVTGFDVDARKVDMLHNGKSYIARIPCGDIEEAQDNGFAATLDFSLIKNIDVVIICVPTPLNELREPDLSYITKTVESIAPHLHPDQLVILESTTFPGTTEEVVVPILEAKNPFGLRVSRDSLLTSFDENRHHPSERTEDNVFYVAFSPEREDPGNTTVARRDIPKVIGGVDSFATELGAMVYGAIFDRTIPVSSPAAAEMTKLVENIYRCVNIALVNELKLLCLRMGLDIWEIIDAAKTKPFGFQPFYPGPGLGGHCIPVDPFYLSWKAKEFDFHTRFIELAGQINTEMPYHVVSEVGGALNARKKALNGANVLLLGVAYKKDVDDLRESPALTIIELLRKAGANVDYNDPFCPAIGRGRKYDLQMKSVPLTELGRYDCVLIVTDHSDYDFPAIVEQAQLVVDTRNATNGLNSNKVLRC